MDRMNMNDMNIRDEAKRQAGILTKAIQAKGYKPAALHVYEDQSGNPLHWRIRCKNAAGDKWIRPLAVIAGKWELKEPEYPNGSPLLCLPHIARNPDSQVWITEGEQKAEALTRLGLVATTSGSASSADKADWTPLVGRSAIIWPDNDEPGTKYAQAVTARLKALGCHVQWLDVARLALPPKGDVMDWIIKYPEATKGDIEALPLIEPRAPEHDESGVWDSPILFDELQTPEIPASLLPGILGEFAKALASATETPEAMAVMAVLGTVSTACASRFCVSPKAGWREPVNIYSLVALPPGNNKSLVLNKATRPLVDWERQQAEILEPEYRRLQSERKTQERYIESLRAKIGKEKDSAQRQALIHDIADLEAELKDVPELPQLFTNDCTPEMLAVYFHEQQGRFAIIGDEGGIFEVVSGLYSGGAANVDILLKGFDGGHVRVKRKDRAFSINPYLTFVMTVQPIIIQNMGVKKAFTGNGMLERFLYALPQSRLGYRTFNAPPVPEHIEQAYSSRIRAFLDIPPLQGENEHEQPRILSLEPAARNEWQDFREYVETQLRPEGKLSPCLGWGGKLPGYALRLAGLLHVAEYGETSQAISLDSMERALELAALLIDHTLAAYNLMGVDQATEDAKAVLQWIKAKGQPIFKQSDCHKALHGRFTKVDRLMKALTALIDRNIISEPERLPTRKPTIIYQVNPAIFTEAK